MLYEIQSLLMLASIDEQNHSGILLATVLIRHCHRCPFRKRYLPAVGEYNVQQFLEVCNMAENNEIGISIRKSTSYRTLSIPAVDSLSL